ncbi:ribosomal RNA small subunit methyltransferase B [Candidatus Rickettsiella viridis]|uniref:16S rRNA (cytosine(967)-C(5))-methyltransferase n=1 Tax=Candidatus Rickettsiella viridis TaxID=676208 RepID=A0A2Z5UTB3_9COXI|nr:16S rRNA (cytosine(967)-C(5))-methyltransferase RsmB [Candidatus Rickettsiella viridis]BBB14674.1 ribosomal RNA small subunit methyltransferase B [Candidatus Rickettsiella viridis]
MNNPRALAAQIIARVLGGDSLTEAFAEGIPNTVESRDRGFIQELCYGVIRWYEPLRQVCSYLLKKPLNANDRDIYGLLLIGLYQFIYLKTAAHAAVHETVQAAKDLKKNWAAALINGVLRSFQRQQTGLLKKLPKEAHYAHPRWLMKKLRQAWPKDWQGIIEANNQAPPMSLRINRLKISRDDYLPKLQAKALEATLSALSDVGIILNETCNVYGLPGFSEGEVSIQDTAAQLAAFLLMLEPKQSVLDACAAPGGKFAHILETQPDLQTAVALDQDKTRLSKVEENLSRLRLMRDGVKLVCIKAQTFKASWQGEQFDRILLDAPCSGTGVIRRHPDIKLLRREEDIDKLAQQQLELLFSLWPLLKPGGILLYATCSVLPEENQSVLQRFLLQQSDAHEHMIDEKWGTACEVGRQIFPQIHGTDGFYYARLQKK